MTVLHGPRISLDGRREEEEGETLEVEGECKAEAKHAANNFLWTKVGEETFRSEGKYLILRNLSHADSG